RNAQASRRDDDGQGRHPGQPTTGAVGAVEPHSHEELSSTGSVMLLVFPQLGITEECLPAPPLTTTRKLDGWVVRGTIRSGASNARIHCGHAAVRASSSSGPYHDHSRY